jgi:hypothetical protein
VAVEPATGPLLKMPNATINVPDGWKKDRALADIQASAASPDYADSVYLSAIESVGGALPLDQQMEAGRSTSSVKPKPKPMDPVEIDGVEWYHLTSDGGGELTEIYGVDHDGYQTGITISFSSDTTPEEREETVAGVLASFSWR